MQRYQTGSWGMVGVDIVNNEDTAQEILAVVYFENNRNSQFGRRVWLPPHSRRIAWYPVKVPENLSAASRLDANAMLLHEINGQEIPARLRGEQTVASRSLKLDQSEAVTGVIAGQDLPIDLFDENSDLVRAMRVSANCPVTTGTISERLLPPISEGWDAAQQIVVAGDQVAHDPAGREALRGWVRGGGRLWLRLDTMQEESVRRLLGDAGCIQYVDQISINQTQLYEVARDKLVEQFSENPVSHLRVLVDDVDVLFTQDDWPAAFVKPYGKGEILFTTVGARGWLTDPAGVNASRSGNTDQPHLKFAANPALQILTSHLFRPDASDLLPDSAIAPVLSEEIGYQIAPRWLVMSILAAFCGALLLVGLFLAGRSQLERMLWIAPVIAISAAVPLFLLGSKTRGAITTSAAMTQFVHVEPEGDAFQMEGLAAVYNEDYTKERIGGDNGGIFEPDRAGIEDTTWRLVRTDLSKWTWEKMQLPPGMRLVPFQSSHRTTKPIRVLGELGPDGLAGTLELENVSSELTDAILATQTHFCLPLEIDAERNITGNANRVLPPGTYDSGTLLTEKQTRHQAIYKALLDSGIGGEYSQESDDRQQLTRAKYPARPTVFVWADAFDGGFQFGRANSEQKGAALLAIPLHLRSTPVGTRVKIPAPLLPYNSVPGPNFEGLSTAYANATGLWQKRSRSSASTLRFQLPDSVLPFEPSSAKLTVRMNAALRNVEISTGTIDALQPAEIRNSPVGEFTIELTEPDALTLDANGGLLMRIDVSDVIKDENSVDNSNGIGNTSYFDNVEDDYWRIEYIKLDMEGTVSDK